MKHQIKKNLLKVEYSKKIKLNLRTNDIYWYKIVIG